MKRKLKVYLEIEVEDLSDAARRENAKLITGTDASEEDLAETLADMPLVADMGAEQIASVAESWLAVADDEMWAGTEMFATFSSVEVLSAAWAE